MNTKESIFSMIAICVLFIPLFSFGQVITNRKVSQKDNKSIARSILSIDTFSDFPPEIEGCSCYFSNDSTDFQNKKYIYVNDFAKTSFLKINGVMIKFTQIDYKEIAKGNIKAKYKSDNFEMTIEVKDGIQNGDETLLKTGAITLIDKIGNKITKTFYGECGC